MGSPEAGSKEKMSDDVRSIHRDNVNSSPSPSNINLPPTPSPDGSPPTAEESASLPHVADTLPRAVWLIAFVVFAERLVFFGLTTPFQNYMQKASGLGLGQLTATDLGYFLGFFQYIVTVPLAVAADSWWGRYQTLLLATGSYFIGIVVIFVTSLPTVLRHGGGLPGLVVGMVFIGIGVGGYKSSATAFIGDQYDGPALQLRTTKNGRVVVDRNVTVESIYNLYYWATNLGSLAQIAATLLEKYVDFWAAYLVPFGAVLLAAFVLVFCKKHFEAKPAGGTVVLNAAKVLWMALRRGRKLDNTRPSVLEQTGEKAEWDEYFIDELKRALIACRVFLLMPIIWLCQFQLSTNLISQAGTMRTSGVPNDLLGLLNPLTVVIVLPIVHRFLYPYLRSHNHPLQPITKILFGFLGESLAMSYAAIVQHLVYSSAPCYNHPNSKSCHGPNHISVFVQLPVYIIEATGEVFMATAIFEYAYTKAPKGMKSVLQAALILTAPVAEIVGFAFAPLYKDPRLIILYGVLAGTAGLSGILASVLLRKYNKMEESLNRLQDDKEATEKE